MLLLLVLLLLLLVPAIKDNVVAAEGLASESKIPPMTGGLDERVDTWPGGFKCASAEE